MDEAEAARRTAYWLRQESKDEYSVERAQAHLAAAKGFDYFARVLERAASSDGGGAIRLPSHDGIHCDHCGQPVAQHDDEACPYTDIGRDDGARV